MSRYIDTDTVKIIIKGGVSVDTYADQEYVCELIDSAPSIDIVRCQDCKHWRNTDAEKIPTASIACGNMHPDDFCSYGEREGE